jgi:hypothetical protein
MVATSPIERMRAYLIGSLRRIREQLSVRESQRATSSLSLAVDPVNVPEMLAVEPGTWSRCPVSHFTNG